MRYFLSVYYQKEDLEVTKPPVAEKDFERESPHQNTLTVDHANIDVIRSTNTDQTPLVNTKYSAEVSGKQWNLSIMVTVLAGHLLYYSQGSR